MCRVWLHPRGVQHAWGSCATSSHAVHLQGPHNQVVAGSGGTRQRPRTACTVARSLGCGSTSEADGRTMATLPSRPPTASSTPLPRTRTVSIAWSPICG